MSFRIQRVNQLLKEELARLLRERTSDPRLQSITIMEVDTTQELERATIYIRTLTDSPTPEEAIAGLEEAQGWLRQRLGKQLHLRRIPEFVFERDETLERARRIEELLEEADTGDPQI